MNKENEDTLISQKEAATILGFKTKQQLVKYIKEGILKTYEKQGSKRKWLDIEEVYKLPKPLPIPPPDLYFQTLKVNERWKKKE